LPGASPIHPTAKDDIGTIAVQANNQDDLDLGHLDTMNLVKVLCPFQLLYSDDAEGLGAESVYKCLCQVSNSRSDVWQYYKSSEGEKTPSTTSFTFQPSHQNSASAISVIPSCGLGHSVGDYPQHLYWCFTDQTPKGVVVWLDILYGDYCAPPLSSNPYLGLNLGAFQ